VSNQHDRRSWGAFCFTLAVLLAIPALVLSFAKVYDGLTLGQVTGLCHSGIGEFGQMLSPAVAANCGHAQLLEDFRTLCWAGVAFSVLAGVILVCSPAAGSGPPPPGEPLPPVLPFPSGPGARAAGQMQTAAPAARHAAALSREVPAPWPLHPDSRPPA
jgi:hypothetical protein